MLIKSKSKSDILSSEITPESIYHDRRRFLAGSLGAAVGLATVGLPGQAHAAQGDALRARAPAGLERSAPAQWWQEKFDSISPAQRRDGFYTNEAITPYRDVISYNNFYEFGMDKGDPSANSKEFKVDPWSITIEGEVAKPGVYTLEDILKPHAMEERVYRLRCVERWSMVIPWVGFSLGDLIKRFEPTSKA